MEEAAKSAAGLQPRTPEMTDAERLRILELTVFGSQRPPVRGLVDLIPALEKRLAAFEEKLADATSNRRFWLQLLAQIAAIGTAAGVIITALR